MLLVDIERERLELRRRDQKDEVVATVPGEGDCSCVEPVAMFVDLCRDIAVDNPAPGVIGQRAIEVLDAMYRSAASGHMESV